MRRIFVILLALLLCGVGCVHSKSLDEYAYVLNIGVEPGTTMPYLVTFLVSVPGGGTEEIEVTNAVLSAEARTFSEATETLNAAYPGRLSFSRASLLVLGEDLVREGAQTERPFWLMLSVRTHVSCMSSMSRMLIIRCNPVSNPRR